MYRFTFVTIPNLVLETTTLPEAMDLIIAWQGWGGLNVSHPVVAVEPAQPTTTPAPPPRPAPPQRVEAAAGQLRPPPEHLPSGRLFDALTSTPQTTLELAVNTEVGARHALNCLERLVKRGFAVHTGTARNANGELDATWTLATAFRKPERQHRTDTPPPNADQHRATPNKGTTTARVFEALSTKWATSLQVSKQLGIPKKSAAQCLTTLFQRGQCERSGPDQGERGYHYLYRLPVKPG